MSEPTETPKVYELPLVDFLVRVYISFLLGNIVVNLAFAPTEWLLALNLALLWPFVLLNSFAFLALNDPGSFLLTNLGNMVGFTFIILWRFFIYKPSEADLFETPADLDAPSTTE